MKIHGAVYGVGEGLTGRCYAFPTLDQDLNKLTHTELLCSVIGLRECATAHPELVFLLTRVGCGLAGFSEDYMRSLFAEYALPSNIKMPEGR